LGKKWISTMKTRYFKYQTVFANTSTLIKRFITESGLDENYTKALGVLDVRRRSTLLANWRHKFANGIEDATFSADLTKEIKPLSPFYVKTMPTTLRFRVRFIPRQQRFTSASFAWSARNLPKRKGLADIKASVQTQFFGITL